MYCNDRHTPEEMIENTLEERFALLLEEAAGSIQYGFQNDYMFRAVFQKNSAALKGLLCAVLNLKEEEVISCEVMNPIILGDSLTEKTCILDLKILLNGNRKVNLEMQIGNLAGWPQRSVYYLCSMYTDLKKGQTYISAEPCVHVGIVSKSPFNGQDEFVSRYFLMNPKNSHIYCSDISLIMIDLSQAGKAGRDVHEESTLQEEKDENEDIRKWARLFCAESWEEALDMAKESESMKEAVVTLRELSEDEKIKEQCFARILYEGDRQRAIQQGLQEGLQQGLQEGLQQGLHQGLQQGEERINNLNQRLIEENRLNDLKRACTDKEFQKTLLEEYGF